jgi:type IV secretory pathway VirB10-like protein
MKYRFDRAVDSPNLVSEPHFDDERTMLSARPVVPLEKINTKVRHRRQWFLAGAFAIAMMLGAFSALLASYLKMRNVQPAPLPQATQVTQVDASEEPVAVAENPPAETPTAVVEENAEETNDAEELIAEESAPKKARPKRRPVATAKPDDYMSDSSDTRRMSEQDALHQIRDTMLYDEWQERRARRVYRRERRRAERYNNHRYLSNLDEIFEGRRRPNP